jgi:chorismate lyase/3-hydroxybenzoate synthase
VAPVLTSELRARRASGTENLGTDETPLGLIVPETRVAAQPAVPVLHVPMPCLGGEAHAQQGWWGGTVLQTARLQEHDGLSLRLAQSEDFLWAVAELQAEQDLLQQAQAVYELLLRTVQEAGKPHLLRLWNYLPRINAVEQGEERYQTFNRGRRRAFAAAGLSVGVGAPAACALGTVQGTLRVAVLAGRQPVTAIENPRQVSAYDYPRQYGVEPPLFSRAAWLPQEGGRDLLLVSGTASIVGHATVHASDVLAQTQESVRNIEAVLQAANARAGRPLWRLEDLSGCVYVRHAGDYPLVRRCLDGLGLRHFCYLQADVCRSDLLVEIEAEAQICPSESL